MDRPFKHDNKPVTGGHVQRPAGRSGLPHIILTSQPLRCCMQCEGQVRGSEREMIHESSCLRVRPKRGIKTWPWEAPPDWRERLTP